MIIGQGDPIRIAISTCPNDTFAFAAMLENRVDLRGIQFHVTLCDIEQANLQLLAGHLDIAKVSYHAAIAAADRLEMLPVGSALGFGVGPLLLSAEAGRTPQDADRSDPTTLCPGRWTTATMLWELFYGGTARVEHVEFSKIMPALEGRRADFGVCIHEGRFTYPSHGLHLVEDLGTRWEAQTGVPLPLGGLAMKRDLPANLKQRLHAVVASSLASARREPHSAMPAMRRYAQEFDDAVLMRHVNLYVNDWTVDLGAEGREAVAVLSDVAREAGLLRGQDDKLGVFEPSGKEP